MKAALLRSHASIQSRPLVIEDVAPPTPGPNEILVKVKACGICRTDLHVIEGDIPTKKLPIIPGHQVVGVVEKTRPGCTRFAPGDRIGIAWLRMTCGSCVYCDLAQENLCESSRYTGYHADGGYAELTTIHEDFAYHIPSGLSDSEAAPLLCAGIIGYRALMRANVPKNGKLGIFGFGSSAHITLQVAQSLGSEVFVSTRGKSHQALAKKMGAVWTGDTFDIFPAQVDSAIIFAPLGDIVPLALKAVRKGGTVVNAGIHMSEIPAMNYEQCLFHEKDLRSVEANTRSDGEQLLKLAASIPIRPKVTCFPLNEANDALIKLKNDGIDGTGVLIIG